MTEWKLVPVEADKNMAWAGLNAILETPKPEACIGTTPELIKVRACYRAMLAAAPEPSDEIVEKGALASELPEHLIERLEKWLREPDWSERCDLGWLLDWVNRRPLDAIAALRAIKAKQQS